MQKYIEMIKDADTLEEINRIVNIASYDRSLTHSEFHTIYTCANTKLYFI